MNISRQKREKMLNFLQQLKAAHTDDAYIQAFNEIENELNNKKYGLVWEEHCEKVDTMIETHIPVLTEVQNRKIIVDDTTRHDTTRHDTLAK